MGMVALSATLAPLACRDGNGGQPPIDDVADVVEVFEDVYSFYCDCYAELYGEPIEECTASFEIVSDSEEACLREVFDANPEAFDVWRCEAEAIRGLLGCMQAQGCPAVFECGDGTGVPEEWVCDGYPDCSNGLDEQQMCPPPPMCDDGMALEPYSVCDGYEDCADGSDEVGCPPPFTCDDGTEIPAEWVCDAAPDCDDGSDEQQQCPVTCESQWNAHYETCGEVSETVQEQLGRCYDYTCSDGTEIMGAQVCDGTQDCPDGEDELVCG